MTSTSTYTLLKDFLTGPGPNLSISGIDFSNTPVSEYKDSYAVILDGVLSDQECHTVVAAAERHTNGKWDRAMVNIFGKQALVPDTRNCGRMIWDSRELADKIWARIRQAVPELEKLRDWPRVTGNGPVKRKETWKITRLNERMRFLKYTSGEYFRPHCDGAYETPNGRERSYFTLHLYLNDANSTSPAGELKGGATTFHSYNEKERLDVEPRVGRVLLFQHRHLLHSGNDVLQGEKLTMRTDIMYELETDS